jgi:hypothetical protein
MSDLIEFIIAAGRLDRCENALRAINIGLKIDLIDIKDVQKITTDALDWLTKDECEKGII